MSTRRYLVETRNDRWDNWRTDGIGENEPRSLEECEEFVAWATSPECDWTRDSMAHAYRIAEVDEDGIIRRPVTSPKWDRDISEA